MDKAPTETETFPYSTIYMSFGEETDRHDTPMAGDDPHFQNLNNNAWDDGKLYRKMICIRCRAAGRSRPDLYRRYNTITITAVGNSVFKVNDVNAEPAYSNKATGGADKGVELVAWMGPNCSHEVGSWLLQSAGS